jgi:hypothetical protein
MKKNELLKIAGWIMSAQLMKFETLISRILEDKWRRYEYRY